MEPGQLGVWRRGRRWRRWRSRSIGSGWPRRRSGGPNWTGPRRWKPSTGWPPAGSVTRPGWNATTRWPRWAWAEQRRDFVAFERERIADARDHAADGRDTTADEREDVADARDRILRRWEEQVRRSDRGGALLQAAAPASGLDLGVVRRKAEQRKSAQRLRVAGGGTRPAVPQPSGAGPAENGSLLTASFAALAQELITDSALAPALQRLLTLMVGVVGGCDCASVWFVAGTEAGTETGPHVATDDSAATLDAIQFHEREGPAVAALSSRTPVYVADLSGLNGGLLPAAADAASVSSALCLGLSVKRSGAWQSLGVISLYGPDCDAFCEADREIAEVFAAFAVAMIDLARTRRDLRQREAALHPAFRS